MVLTDKELDTINAIAHSDFQDMGDPANHWIWSWSVAPHVHYPHKGVGGVIASLCKKGLAETDGWGSESCVRFTQAGRETYYANLGGIKVAIDALQAHGQRLEG